MSVKVVYEDVAVGAADAATVASSDANAFPSSKICRTEQTSC